MFRSPISQILVVVAHAQLIEFLDDAAGVAGDAIHFQKGFMNDDVDADVEVVFPVHELVGKVFETL